MFRTTRDIRFDRFCEASLIPSPFTLPKGSPVKVIECGQGPAYASALSTRELIALSGDPHDPIYRYLWIDGADVESVA